MARAPNSWILALKEWRASQPKGTLVPLKGSAGYEQVRKIQEKYKSTPKIKEKKPRKPRAKKAQPAPQKRPLTDLPNLRAAMARKKMSIGNLINT